MVEIHKSAEACNKPCEGGAMSALSELFARDPLKLTTSDIDTIIERLRQAQHQFNLAAQCGPKPRRAKPRKGEQLVLSLVPNLDKGQGRS